MSGDNLPNQALAAGCDRYYSIQVGPGHTLSTTVQPEASLDVGIDIDTAASPTAPSPVDNGDVGIAESTSFTNTTSATRTFYIRVFSPMQQAGSFSLTATVS